MPAFARYRYGFTGRRRCGLHNVNAARLDATGAAHHPDRIPTADFLPGTHCETRQMRIVGLHSATVVHYDETAIAAIHAVCTTMPSAVTRTLVP